MSKPLDGRRRVVIEGVRPEIDCGRFPIKRVIGDTVVVEADVFGDGHDHVAASVLFRRDKDRSWKSRPMKPLGNDRWRGDFAVAEMGKYWYTVSGLVDHFGTWRADLAKRIAAGQDVRVDLRNGALLVTAAATAPGCRSGPGCWWRKMRGPTLRPWRWHRNWPSWWGFTLTAALSLVMTKS